MVSSKSERMYVARAVVALTTGVAVGALSGCGGGGSGEITPQTTSGTTGTPIATVSTSTVTFAPTDVGSNAVQQLTLSNTGTASLAVATLTISSSNFQVAGGTCAAGSSLSPGSSCTIDVRFAPAAAGPLAAVLSIGHSAASATSSASLSGLAMAALQPAGTLPNLTAADCPRLVSQDQAVAALAITGADMQQVADILRTTSPGHGYQIFVRAPAITMWWIRNQGGSIGLATIGAGVHEANHAVDNALRTVCNTDRFARLLLNGTVYVTALVNGNGSTANYSIAGETVPAALQTGARYATYIQGAAAFNGNDFAIMLDELNAYTGAAEAELGLLADPTYGALRVAIDANAGGQVDFMLYTLAYLKAARLNHPAAYATVRSQPATLQYLQAVWSQAESNLFELYPYTALSGGGSLVVSKEALAAAYSADLITELDLLGIAHRPASAWATTYFR